MKIGKRFFFVASILFLFSLISFGQAKPVAKEIYDSAVKEAHINTDKKVRTEITVQKRFENKTLKSTINYTQQFLPPDKSRWIILDKLGDAVQRTEIIYIGDIEYRKIDKGEWVERNLKSEGDGIGDTKEDKSINDYSLEEIKAGKQKYRVFSIFITNRSETGSTYFTRYKVWIKDKIIFKITSDTSYNELENIISTSVRNYDYNPKKFNIEAPALVKKTK